MLSVSDYWDQKIQKNVIFSFTISYMMTNLIGLVFIVFWGDRVPVSELRKKERKNCISFTNNDKKVAIRIVPGLILFMIVLTGLLFVENVVVANVLVAVLGNKHSYKCILFELN